MAVTGANNAYTGGQTVLLLGPEHAETIAADGFTKMDVIHWQFLIWLLIIFKFSLKLS